MTSSKRLLILLFAAAAVASCGKETAAPESSAPAAAAAASTSYEIPGDRVFPEGIAYNAASGIFYTGSTQDGTLFAGNLDTGEVTVFSAAGSDGRHAATGMKIDSQGRLWVSGAGTGRMFVYDTTDGALIAEYSTPEPDTRFINDVALDSNGNAWFTDSFRPHLFRIDGTAGGEVEPWLDFTGTVLEYEEGFNLNGIVITGDDRYAFVVHTGNGGLFRIDTENQDVIKVDLAGTALAGGDGLLLEGNTLYVVRNRFGEIVPVTLGEDLSTGTVGAGITHESFAFPTTMARAGDSFLVVIAQIDKRESSPELPFIVSRIRVTSQQ